MEGSVQAPNGLVSLVGPRITRRPPSPDTARELSRYFDRAARKAGYTFEPTNFSALSGTIARWKREGLDADRIRLMVDAFFRTNRNLRGTPWKVFVSQRHKLIEATEDPARSWGRSTKHEWHTGRAHG